MNTSGNINTLVISTYVFLVQSIKATFNPIAINDIGESSSCLHNSNSGKLDIT